jgi:hypothetical protein
MQRQQKKEIKQFLISKYYEYNFKKTTAFSAKYTIIRENFNLINDINYNKIILKLVIWYKIKKYNQFFYSKKVNGLQNKPISKTEYTNIYFNKLYNNIRLYFSKNKHSFFNRNTIQNDLLFDAEEDIKYTKRTYQNVTSKLKRPLFRLIKTTLESSKLAQKKDLKLPDWKSDRLFFFKRYFFEFSTESNLKNTSVSQIELTDYTLRSQFKSSINFENVKTHYGVIRVKPSGANIFITLTNYYGDVFLRFQQEFLMK